jgi:hypothetical protein
VTKAEARNIVQRERGNSGRFILTLFINPDTGIRFYQLDSQQANSRIVFHRNAETGKKIKEYGNLQESSETLSDPGIGVKGDTKQIDTTFDGPVHQMISDDDRQATYDAQNRGSGCQARSSPTLTARGTRRDVPRPPTPQALTPTTTRTSPTTTT